MNKILETIVYDINPVNDMTDMHFERLSDYTQKQNYTGGALAQLKNISQFIKIVKPYVRGNIIGGATGAIINGFNGDSIGEGFKYGALIGGALDLDQFMIRGFVKYLKIQYSQTKEDNSNKEKQ